MIARSIFTSVGSHLRSCIDSLVSAATEDHRLPQATEYSFMMRLYFAAIICGVRSFFTFAIRSLPL